MSNGVHHTVNKYWILDGRETNQQSVLNHEYRDDEVCKEGEASDRFRLLRQHVDQQHVIENAVQQEKHHKMRLYHPS